MAEICKAALRFGKFYRQMSELELYIHIPFCVRKCNYCDFLSAPADDETRESYVNALINEIRLAGITYGDRKITSIFVGGGTPSTLSPDQITRIADALKETFDLEGLMGKPKTFFRKKAVPPTIEFTVECNPGTLDKDKLKALKKAGVNRLSIGLQSAEEKELKELGRIYTVRDFLNTFEDARMAGFENINVDLMQAVPYQTLGSWRKTLMSVTALRPEHISAYSLQMEEGTPFYDRMQKGEDLHLPDEDTEREIYYATKEILGQFGYERYEISNYALPGKECVHNCGYWTRKNYLGLGIGSSSMVDNVRWKNTDELEYYINCMSAGKGLDALHTDVENVSYKEQMEEYMFLGLRMVKGITKEEFFETFKTDFDFIYGSVARELLDQGLMEEVEEEYEDPLTSFPMTKTRIFLTDKGIDVSNRVLAQFLQDEDESDT